MKPFESAKIESYSIFPVLTKDIPLFLKIKNDYSLKVKKYKEKAR